MGCHPVPGSTVWTSPDKPMCKSDHLQGSVPSELASWCWGAPAEEAQTTGEVCGHLSAEKGWG